jgi:hypothetical protein
MDYGGKGWHDSCFNHSKIGAARMVTLERRQGCKRTNKKGVTQMGLLIGAAGAITMMAVSLAFQRVSYNKVTVTVRK